MSGNGNAQEVTQGTQILHSKLRGKECHDGFLKIMGGGDEDDVINIKQDISQVGATSIDEEREALALGHRVIFVSGTHNLADEDHGNPMADACRLSHEGHHVEKHFGHLADE
ncbi:hypothetical protein A2U01_0032759 [Trifolium medium]|uniref:Uncharacterized protein n=1 Tax=Trifolium medium TaxID=97028 RepID=A0A392PJ42_9FABA|nr:hypothetical protein [Trifolium medium]